MDIEKSIREYFSNILHMSLATCLNNKPWVCEVHFVFDKNLNLYFRSTPMRRHSKEIAINPNVAGNIVTQHGLEEKVRGVYFEGIAQQLDDIDEDNPVYKLFCDRLGKNKDIIEQAKSPEGHKFYKIKVTTFYLFDARESTPGQKYVLEWNKV